MTQPLHPASPASTGYVDAAIAGAVLKSNQGAGLLGFAAWSGDPGTLPGSPTPSAGAIYYERVYVDAPAVCQSAYLSVVTAGVTVANAFIGVYDVLTGTRLAVSGDISTAVMTVQLVKAPLTTPITSLVLNQELYIAFVIGSAGTLPVLCGGRTNGANGALTADLRTQVKSGSATSLPATVSPGLTVPASMAVPFVAIGA